MTALERPRVSLTATRTDSLTLALVSLIGVMTAAHALYYAPRVVDDLFISLKYAENLAHGRGLVFNPGERVEGFSSPLWVLLQAVGLRVGFEGVLFTKVLGALALAGTHLALHRFTREIFGVAGPFALLPNVVLALDSFFVAWSGLGLETPLLTALVLGSFVLCRRFAEGRASRTAPAIALVALAAVRPEGPLWVAVVLATEGLATPWRGRRRLLALVSLAATVGATCAALLLARRLYFGAFLPNTYLVKGADVGRDLDRLRPLVGQGAAPIERVAWLGGAALLAAAALRRGRLGGIAVVGTTAFFVVHVEKDWMPDLRHFLPLLVVAPVGFAWAAARVSERGGPVARAAALGLVVVPLVGAGVTARVDARNVQDPFGDRKWNRWKSMALARDARDALRRREPTHVTAMDPYWMGMVTQNYRLMEASAAPLEDSWYAGRDIGKVGYYVPARVFDTAGLFTPAVVQDAAWRVFRRPSGPLVDEMLRRAPVALELYDQWPEAFAREPRRLLDHRVLVGSQAAPIDLERLGPGPEPEEILRRYEASLAKFPRAFYLSTLYGESVGAAMEKRTRIVRDIVGDLRAMGEPPPEASPAGVAIGDEVVSRGCALIAPVVVRPGAEVVGRCWLDVRRASRTPWILFVHFVDERGVRTFAVDHVPGGGLTPATKWRDGQRVRDAFRFVVPAGVRGLQRMVFGLYHAGARAPASGPDTKDDGLLGPRLFVQ